MEQELCSIWARIGMRLDFTPEEVDAILSDSTTNADRKRIVKRVFAEGRFELEGDSYIPGVIIDDFNAEHGTQYAIRAYAYSADDVDWDMSC